MGKSKIYIISLVTVLLLILTSILLFLVYQNNRIDRFSAPGNAITKDKSEYLQDTTGNATFLVFTTGSKDLTAEEVDYTGVGKVRGGMKDGLTDSIMLFRVNSQNKRVAVISIPRDTYLESTGRRINEVFVTEGVDGLVERVGQLTGIRADHQISVNFNAFAQIVDILGGIQVYFNEPVLDKNAKLRIDKAGCTLLDGKNALAFARARSYLTLNENGVYTSSSLSSDWGRMVRQQFIVGSILKKIKSNNNIAKIPHVINSLTGSLTVDRNLSITDMLSYAKIAADSNIEMKYFTFPGIGKSINGASVILPSMDEYISMRKEIDEFIEDTNNSKESSTPQRESEGVNEQPRSRLVRESVHTDDSSLKTGLENEIPYKEC